VNAAKTECSNSKSYFLLPVRFYFPDVQRPMFIKKSILLPIKNIYTDIFSGFLATNLKPRNPTSMKRLNELSRCVTEEICFLKLAVSKLGMNRISLILQFTNLPFVVEIHQ